MDHAAASHLELLTSGGGISNAGARCTENQSGNTIPAPRDPLSEQGPLPDGLSEVRDDSLRDESITCQNARSPMARRGDHAEKPDIESGCRALHRMHSRGREIVCRPDEKRQIAIPELNSQGAA